MYNIFLSVVHMQSLHEGSRGNQILYISTDKVFIVKEP